MRSDAHCDDSVYYAHVVNVPDTGIEITVQ